MTDDEFRQDCMNHISVNSRGAIVYQSILCRRYPGRIGVVLQAIEDHIINDETIDWPEVWKDYSL